MQSILLGREEAEVVYSWGRSCSGLGVGESREKTRPGATVHILGLSAQWPPSLSWAPSPNGSPDSLKSNTIWGAGLQRHDPMGDISFSKPIRERKRDR